MEKFYRLFAAVDFTDEEKELLYRYGLRIKERSAGGNFTHRENFHLTLAFIGETRRREEAEEAVREGVVRSRVAPFAMETDRLGRFKAKGGDILWAGLKESPQLNRLYEEITRSLRLHEFSVEEQKFKAHLTLGRCVVLKEKEAMEELSQMLPRMRIQVNTVHLMNSQRVEGKLKYSSLCSMELS